MSDLSVWQKSPELIVNLRISADTAFSFWAIESKRKRGFGGISRKGQFKPKENDQSHFFWTEIDCEVI